MTVSDWQRHAACATADPALFLTETEDATQQARRFCAACSVTAACLAAAMGEEQGTPAADRAGVRGGLTPEERAARDVPATEPCHEAPTTVSRPRKKAAGPVVCGTRAGYQKHRRNGEEACAPCRYANTAADRRLRTTGSTVRPADLAPAACAAPTEGDSVITDLFSGARGWGTVLRQLGLHSLGLEIDPYPCATARAAGYDARQVDVTAEDTAAHAETTGLIASPTCRPWVSGGLGQGRLDRQLVSETIDDLAAGRDPRHIARALCANPDSLLAAEPMRWIRDLRPEWVCMEQVPAVLPLWEQYAEHLRVWGYSVWTGVLQAADWGAPQTRRRAIFIASRVRQVHAPAPTHAGRHRSMADALGIDPATVLVSRRDSVARLAAHGPRRNRTAGEPAPTITGEVWRWKWEFPDGTVRPVTASEAGVLQTFPADHPWQGPKTKVALQIGNAIPPALAAHVVSAATGIPLPATHRLAPAA